MKKELKKVGKGELENNNLKRILDAQEEEHLADYEIAQFLRTHKDYHDTDGDKDE